MASKNISTNFIPLIKKICAGFLAVTTLLCLAGCVSDEHPEKWPADNFSDVSTTQGENSTVTTTTQPVSNEVSLPEQVIFEQNDIKITVTGLDNSGFWGPAVKLLIENNSTQNITVQTRNCSVNGIMVDPLFSEDVASNKKANTSIDIFSSELKAAGVSTIKDIEFYFTIFDAESWNTIVDSEVISLTTSADPSFVQTYDDSGFVAYDKNGVKIVAKKISSEDSFWGAELYLYIENNTDKNITVQSRDVSVNGFMIDPIFSADIVSGKKAFDSLTFFDSDLEENEITDIVDLELKFIISDMESWHTLEETEIISIHFE